jgi:hypothetical protein
MKKIALLVLLVIIGTASFCIADSVAFYGYAYRNGSPLSGYTIQIYGTAYTCVIESNGYFEVGPYYLATGTYSFVATKPLEGGLVSDSSYYHVLGIPTYCGNVEFEPPTD